MQNFFHFYFSIKNNTDSSDIKKFIYFPYSLQQFAELKIL